ncbi:hypothetical protein QD460_03020 [Rhizobium jaguaris]|uniref:Uncharacterized protein n=1 Tax=Rhizobium jaguaris TaxID=1312183 RepID=A0A387G5C4_9HYPH|nr:hypothetical protein [Rhizobium jaguaris]AYG62726.1 hypothetical protein CCGE525_28735 [Rhizobium jaguaris]
MRRYNLRLDGEAKWEIVDRVTMRTAELGGAALRQMPWAEACDMISILNSLNAIESVSRGYEALTAAE